MRSSPKDLVCCALLLAGVAVAEAQVRTDGSLGSASTLTGPNFQIPASLGRQVGGNLFHSFSQFNLSQGQSATFSGPANVQNILARVTGGSASSIDGTLRSTIQGANLYLLNPNGVVFGPNASVDVSGSFVVSTADYLKLADGGRFDARVPGNSVLTAAPVEKFGFLGNNPPGKITVDGSQLVVNAGQTITLVGGDIEIKNNALVQAPGGAINLVSVGLSAVEVSPNPSLAELGTGGSITVSDGARVDASGEQGGRISVRGRSLTLDAGQISSGTAGDLGGLGITIELTGAATFERGGSASTTTTAVGAGGPIDVTATSIALSQGGQISTSTLGTGAGGNVSLTANSLTLTSDLLAGTKTGVFADTSALLSGGRGGDISVSANEVELNPGTRISSSTSGSGDGGRLLLRGRDQDRARRVFMDGNALSSQAVTGLLAETSAGEGGGRGGDIEVRAEALDVHLAGRISTTTSGSGRGGDIRVLADSISMDALGGFTLVKAFTGILAETTAMANGGRGGNVTIEADTFRTSGGGGVSTTTFGSGSGGNILFTARSARFAGNPLYSFAGLQAQTLGETGGGNGGNITVRVDELTVVGEASISSSTRGSGNGGLIEIRGRNSMQADSVKLEGGFFSEYSGVLAETLHETLGGRGGDITIRARSLELDFSARISTTTFGPGNAGTIRIEAQSLTAVGEVSGPSTGVFAESAGGTGLGGNISVDAQRVRLETGAGISSSTSGQAAGGSISVRADTITLVGSLLSVTGFRADTSGSGKGGDVTVNAGRLEIQSGATISSSTYGSGNGGQVKVTANEILIGPGILNDSELPATFSELPATFIGFQGIQATTTDLTPHVHEDEGYRSPPGFGKAGDIIVRAGRLTLFDGAGISATSASSGRGGNVDLQVGSLLLAREAFIEAASKTTGDSGQVSIRSDGDIVLRAGSEIASSADLSNAGGILLRSGTRIEVYDSRITSQAALNGGELRLEAPNIIHLSHSRVTTEAGGTGGNITIDPQTVSLNQSTISANALAGNGGNITINTDFLLRSQDSQITASSQFGLNGAVSILGPSVDLSGSLITFPVGLLGAESRLPERCAVRLPGNFSSFISVGRGGLPLEPSDFQPGFLLIDETPRKKHP